MLLPDLLFVHILQGAIVLFLTDIHNQRGVAGHSGHELPEGCEQPYVICWSKKLRNRLVPGVLTLLQPPANTHELRCERQSEPEFRRGISERFKDVTRLSYQDVSDYVHQNLEELRDLALTYDKTFGALNPQVSSGRNFLSMNRTDCLMAYLSGKMLLPFARASSMQGVLTELEREHVFEQLWYLMINWVDIASTEWPVLSLLEFFAVDLRSSTGTGQDGSLGTVPDFKQHLGDSGLDLWQLVGASSPSWATAAAQLFALPRSSWSMASGHLALALALLDAGAEAVRPLQGLGPLEGGEATWDVQWLVSLSLFWLRSAPARPSPALQLLRGAPAYLALWGRLWRHPRGPAALRAPAARCPARFDPLWELRRLGAGAARRALPGGRWPLAPAGAAPPPAPPGPAAPGARAREAWATAVAVGGVAGAEARAWLEAVRVLHASVRRHEAAPRRPFLVAVEAGLDEALAAVLRADGMEPVALEPIIAPGSLAQCPRVQRRAEGLRFRLFGLVHFDRIIYIDADAIVVGPLTHLFASPPGIFLSGTINGTRWTYRSRTAGNARKVTVGPAMINTGLMVITPSDEFVPAVEEVLDVAGWLTDDSAKGWAACAELPAQGRGIARQVCRTTGVFIAFCTQGLIDAVLLALGPRLGDAAWAHTQAGERFLGCFPPPGREAEGKTLQPRPKVEHCTLDEAYNLQVTRPHLGWHMPFLHALGRSGGGVRVVHWPGKPKPWRLAASQRTEWDSHWWEIQSGLCQDAGAGLPEAPGGEAPAPGRGRPRGCLLRC